MHVVYLDIVFVMLYLGTKNMVRPLYKHCYGYLIFELEVEIGVDCINLQIFMIKRASMTSCNL